MSKITVRAETADDIRAIDVVNLSAFEGDTEAQLVGAVRASPGFVPELSLVAEFNGRIVGHVLLSKVHYRHAGGEQDILALAPMSVVPSQSHRGIGKALLDEALLRARKLGFPAVVVVGQPEYYERFGFLPGDAMAVAVHAARGGGGAHRHGVGRWGIAIRWTDRLPAAVRGDFLSATGF